MKLLLTATVIVVLATWVWMAWLGVVAARHDPTLTPFQRKAQSLLSIAIPIVGAALVLHLVHLHSPDAIPRRLIPRPLRSLVFAKPLRSRRR